jgi:thioredoxin-related protein
MKKLLLTLIATAFLFTQCNNVQEDPPEQPYPADYILETAMKVAKKEKKNIFIMWHASWCGWCHRMDSLMQRDDMKEYFEGNYVIEHMVVKERQELKHLENPGADSVLASYNGDKSGIPFWVILDKKGNLLADSFMREEGVGMDQPGDNTGCPAQPAEVDHLLKVIKETSDTDDAGLEKIRETFLMKR